MMENFNRLGMNLVFSLFCCFLLVNAEKVYDEESGRAYLKKINADIQVRTTESVLASWAYESNITDENLKVQLDVSAKLANYTKEIWKETVKYPWKTFKDPDVRRQFQKFSVLGTAILSPPKYERFNKIISDMQSVYGKARICNYNNRTDCNMQLEPELTEIFVKSRDPDELRYYWQEWRNAAGKPVRKMYKEYVDLSNEAAVLNNFTDNSEFWLKDYEAPDFKQQVEELWEQLRPLYLQLHAYVRRRLREQYGEKHVPKKGPIPAHLLGNMWAQSWSNIFDFTVPYPGKPSMDVTPNMVEQGYTPLRMFKLAEQFFTSLRLSPMPDTFWKNSILEKPTDGRDLICHASAWDFYDGKDFRIKQCTRVTMEDLNTVHHEMGHVQYFLQYKNQPLVYKEGTNPGFHEAVGDVMALSVSTPKHLRKIGLLNATEDDDESEINQLYNMALDKIAFLPFGYLMDQWRWNVFQGKISERDYNCKWWQLREKYQGLSPSVTRSECDFDPGAKYHTVGNVPYIRYFVSFVIQFQFHRSLCIAAKEFDPNNPNSKPLHKCDIYQSQEAGALLKKMLQMGSSKPWPDAMEVMTGQRKMNARALLDYFAALQVWLEKENKRTGEYIGWETQRTECDVEDVQKATPSDAQGPIEDSNIAYPYAEFVRPDDNSFGFPDYLEEIQPSYHALHNSPKKNFLPANYYLPKKAPKITEAQKAYIPDEPTAQQPDDYTVMTDQQFYKSKLKGQHWLEVPKNYFTDENLRFQKPFKKSHMILKKPVYHWENERNRMNDILQNPETLNEPLDSNDALKWISNRDISDNDSKDKKVNQENKDPNALAKLALFEKKRGFAKELMRNQAILDLADVSAEHEFQKIKGIESGPKSNDSPVGDSKMKVLPECILENAKKFCFNSMDYQAPRDLIWKAESVKSDAEKMLKSFNFTSNGFPSVGKTRYMTRPFTNPYMPDYNQPNNFMPPPNDNPERLQQMLSMNFRENLFRNPSMSSLQIEKPNFFRNPQFPRELLEENSYKPHGRKRSPKKRKRNEYTVVMLLENSKNNKKTGYEKKNRKRSYKEYHYKVKTPVVYNSVVITPGGRTEKTDDIRDRWSKLSSRVANLLDVERERDSRVSEYKPKRNIFLSRNHIYVTDRNNINNNFKRYTV